MNNVTFGHNWEINIEPIVYLIKLVAEANVKNVRTVFSSAVQAHHTSSRK